MRRAIEKDNKEVVAALLEKGVKYTTDNVLITYLIISDNICVLVMLRYY